MRFADFLQQNNVYLDGGMGTLLQERGLGAGEQPERWNITHAQDIVDIHTAYFNAGSNVVCTNTFGLNGLKFSAEELKEIVSSAVKNAKSAAEESGGGQHAGESHAAQSRSAGVAGDTRISHGCLPSSLQETRPLP